MLLAQKYALCLCILLLSTGIMVEAGFMKRRQSEMAMLLAGGLLTLLFRDGHSTGHSLGSLFGGHKNDHQVGGFGHPHQFPGFMHGHPMAGFGHHHMMAGLGHHHPMPGHGMHAFAGLGHKPNPMAGFGNYHQFARLGYNPMMGLGHMPQLRSMGRMNPFAANPNLHHMLQAYKLQSLTHGYGGALGGTGINVGHLGQSIGLHGLRSIHGLNNNEQSYNLKQHDPSIDAELDQILKELENEEPARNHKVHTHDEYVPYSQIHELDPPSNNHGGHSEEDFGSYRQNVEDSAESILNIQGPLRESQIIEAIVRQSS